MLRAIFLSFFRSLRARWIRPPIQTAPIFPFSFHRVVSVHDDRHRDDQSQASSSCCPEDRRGNHFSSLSSPFFSLLFLLLGEPSPRVRLPVRQQIWKRSAPLNERGSFEGWFDYSRCVSFPSCGNSLTLLVPKSSGFLRDFPAKIRASRWHWCTCLPLWGGVSPSFVGGNLFIAEWFGSWSR